MSLTPEQLAMRKYSLGGSDAAVAVGISPYKTPLELYFEKTGLKEPDDISDNNAVYWGVRLEEIIAEEYIRRTGNEVDFPKDTFYHPDHVFITAHVDGRMQADKKLLECKTANLYLEKEWGEIESDEVPLHYIVQCQHYMSVFDYDVTDLAVLIGGQDYRIYTLQRDNELIDNLINAEQVFWARVKNLDPPPPSNNDDLKLIYGQDSGGAIESTAEIEATLASLKSLKANIKTMDTEKTELEFLLKKYMEDNTTLLQAGSLKALATWKTQKNNRFQTPVFREDHPALCEQYTKNSPTRVLRLKK